jgi:hypothetical protein
MVTIILLKIFNFFKLSNTTSIFAKAEFSVCSELSAVEYVSAVRAEFNLLLKSDLDLADLDLADFG